MTTLHKFKNLIQLLEYFAEDKVCREYLELIRWNGNLVCPYKDCAHNHVFKYSDGKRYKCSKCLRQYSVKVGTIFEDSKITLRKWYAAIYLITSHKKGISSHQLARDISVTQKTAWFMLHRVRHTLGITTTLKLDGTVEADETFIGGDEKNKHKHKRTAGTQGRSVKTKTPVIGVIKRGGELRAAKVPDTRGYNLRQFIVKNVAFGANLHTDEWHGYRHLKALFQHKYVKHNENEYVSGTVHANTLEGFWSLFKRGIDGIYHSISDKHLQQYVDEFVFRYNTRTFTESFRFDSMLNNINSHITYKQLTNGNPPANKQVEAKQKSISFPNEDAQRDVQ